MNTLPKRMILGATMFAVIAGIAGVLIASVGYEPHGVPKALRPAFKAKIAEVKQRAEMRAITGEIAKPMAVFDETDFHFGLLDPHTTISHSFTLRNEGDAPLTVNIRETSCKCTVGKLGNDVLLPGGQTDVTLTWNTGYQVDQYEQTATVVTNDPFHSQIKLRVAGEVRAELVLPDKLAMKTVNPGDVPEASFVVYSQLWDDFYLDAADSELPSFHWYVDPLSTDHPSLHDKQAKWAWKVTVSTSGKSRGGFAGTINLHFKSPNTDHSIDRSIAVSGHVRAPISFYSPDIHRHEGLDIGTLSSGTKHEFKLVVRNRGELDREIEVTSVQPKELTAALQPMSKPGEYRLVLTIPADCPTVMFNRAQQHGYVEVGDPRDKAFRNWFPVFGAVVKVD